MDYPEPFNAEMFERLDDSEDERFYEAARKVVHIDESAIAAVGDFIGTAFAPNGVLLDLMSSWRSHLPEGFQKQRLVGLGMNAEEMADNPDLDDYVVHNLNVDPVLPFEDDFFNGAIITVSIQYMIKPLEVFAEVCRILKPGAPFAVFFSNRMFPTKAIRVWQVIRDVGKREMVEKYFQVTEGFEEPLFYDVSPNPGASDPMYVVCARKQRQAEDG
jgi:SAM-dependent methyltransferase